MSSNDSREDGDEYDSDDGGDDDGNSLDDDQVDMTWTRTRDVD